MEPLKNMFTHQLVSDFANHIVTVYPLFNRTSFVDAVFDDSWDSKELKQRYCHIAARLRDYLPQDYLEALDVLKQLSPQYSGFPYIFFSEFVAIFGLEHWDASVEALRLFTPIASSEFAVRPFIEQDQERMLGHMLQWTRHENEHVRRLASEGCRPRLPWGRTLKRLIADPAPVLPILDALKHDPSEYVRRSVANNLNDISKDHPHLVLEWTKQRLGSGGRETERMLKHGCRTLLKKGMPEALSLFGFETDKSTELVEVLDLVINPAMVKLGDEIDFSFTLSSPEPASFRLQFAVDYIKANGTSSRKRFHLPEKRQFRGEATIRRTLSLQDYTTRKHYPGSHRLAILVNGLEKAAADFLVTGEVI